MTAIRLSMNWKMLFLPWDKAEKYGHSDGIVKAILDDTVLITNYADFDTDMASEIKRRLSAAFYIETLCYDGHKRIREVGLVSIL